LTGDETGEAEAPVESRPRGRRAPTSHLERQFTLQQLRVFKSVVDHRSFTRAAASLFLTQPAVTHQVQALSRTMGQPLFTGRGTTSLTPLGDVVYDKACRILTDLRELSEAMEDVDAIRAGTIRVTGDVTFGTYILPRAVGAFRSVHPDVQVQLTVAHGSTIRDRLLHREADLGVVGRLWQDSRIGSRPVMENIVACYCAPGHRLASGESVRLESLAERVLLLREEGAGLSDAVQKVFDGAGLTLRPAMLIADNEARKRAAVEGLGVAVLSTYAVRSELAVGLLVPLEVDGFPIRQTWHAVWLTGHELRPPAEAFRSFLCAESWGGAEQ